MYVTLTQLQVFEAMTRQLNYTVAAQELRLIQSVISIKINLLAENLSKSLYDQIGKNHYTRIIARQPEEADGVLQQLKEVQSGKLNKSVATIF